MSSTIDLGIDLGTTNSAIAHYQEGNVVVFKNPINLKETLASVVAFKKDRIIVGDKAREMLQKSSQNVFGLFKRKMGTTETYLKGDSMETLTPIELSSMVLKELKNFNHKEVTTDSVVITIPSAFDTIQSNATKKAGYAAGFKEVVLLQEPIAASLAYANKSNLDISDGKWLVYDLGGGTFDVALTAIDDGELKILDHEGDNYLGGTDFDKAIIDQFIIPELEKLGQFDNLVNDLKLATGKYNRLYYKLIFLAEEAKKMLTTGTVAEIEFEITDDQGKDLEVYLELPRATFEKFIAASIDRTIELIDTIISRNELSQTDLKCILLIGGSTYIPYVREKLKAQYGIEMNTSLDPTTAVVIGAAYYAGIKPKRIKPTTTSTPTNIVPSKDFKLAYERIVRDDSGLLIIAAKRETEGLQYRISRTDGGYDSGMVAMQAQVTLDLPLVANTHNGFLLQIFDAQANPCFQEEIGITQGKFSIDGQPLPNNICLEVDALENQTTFLEPIFKKNDILPLRKVITKQVSQTILKGSDQEIVIKVFEGDIDSIPAANKLIGMISLSGEHLERDLVKGSDVELTLEITESRDLKVAAYFTLTDQEFENTFSSSESNITKVILLAELQSFEANLNQRIKVLEREGNYEVAGRAMSIKADIESLRTTLDAVVEDQTSDDFYILDVKKREIAKQMQSVFNTSFLTKTIEDYYEAKNRTSDWLLDKDAIEADRKAFEDATANEQKLLRDGNITAIKMKMNQLSTISQRIARRTPITNDDIEMTYMMIKFHPFVEQERAQALIEKGDEALISKNHNALISVINDLSKLKSQEGNNDLFKNKGTGLK